MMNEPRTWLPSVGIALAMLFLFPGAAAAQEQRPELGLVRWGRELDAALERSKREEKPVFLLFQEVPG